jgi:hypothetical protein
VSPRFIVYGCFNAPCGLRAGLSVFSRPVAPERLLVLLQDPGALAVAA